MPSLASIKDGATFERAQVKVEAPCVGFLGIPGHLKRSMSCEFIASKFTVANHLHIKLEEEPNINLGASIRDIA